jgi:hypothetical protein
MYIVAIAWLYVAVLMAATEANITAGVLTFVFYGLLPCALFIWIIGTPQRRRTRLAKESLLNITQQELGEPDGTDTKPD